MHLWNKIKAVKCAVRTDHQMVPDYPKDHVRAERYTVSLSRCERTPQDQNV